MFSEALQKIQSVKQRSYCRGLYEDMDPIGQIKAVFILHDVHRMELKIGLAKAKIKHEKDLIKIMKKERKLLKEEQKKLVGDLEQLCLEGRIRKVKEARKQRKAKKT